MPALPRSPNCLLSTPSPPALPLQARRGRGQIDGRVSGLGGSGKSPDRSEATAVLGPGRTVSRIQKAHFSWACHPTRPFWCPSLTSESLSPPGWTDVAVVVCSSPIPDFLFISALWLKSSTLLPLVPIFLWLSVRKAL